MTPRVCPTCGGSGEVRFNRSARLDPQADDAERCRACNGTGVLKTGGAQ